MFPRNLICQLVTLMAPAVNASASVT